MNELNRPLTNDTANLVAMTGAGPRVVEFDFPGLEVGVAEYEEGPTGCTVFAFPRGSLFVADVRGGSPGTILSHREGWIDAVCLAGGSVYGLEAATGVSAELLAARDYDTDWMNIAMVAGAVIFDFNALRRSRAVYPDRELGRAAYRTRRRGIFPVGPRGAGRCATVGKWLRGAHEYERGGQGCASFSSGDTRHAVFTVVNSVGAIVDRDGTVVRGHLDRETGRRARVGVRRGDAGADSTQQPDRGNTTLSVVVVNHKMALRELRQFARQVHASMARAIDPFHTPYDGDVLYAVATGQVESPSPRSNESAVVASELAWDAVLESF